MRIPADAAILVADGRKMLMLRNRGDETRPDLRVEDVREQQNPATRDQGSDAPGAGFSPTGTRRGVMEQTDFHQLEEDRFAAEAADMLKRGALSNAYEALIVVAPPETLGELRKHYHKAVEDRILGEITKDLTGHPVDEIERIVAAG